MSRGQTPSDQLLRELTEERAAALLRISRTLESAAGPAAALREALGLRHHQRLDEFYPIPPPEPAEGR
jgi:hypothetical protein